MIFAVVLMQYLMELTLQLASFDLKEHIALPLARNMLTDIFRQQVPYRFATPINLCNLKHSFLLLLKTVNGYLSLTTEY